MVYYSTSKEYIEIPKHTTGTDESINITIINKSTHTDYSLDAVIEDMGKYYKVSNIDLDSIPDGEYEYVVFNGLNIEVGIIIIGNYDKKIKEYEHEAERTIQYES